MTPAYRSSATLLVNQAQTPGVVTYQDILGSQQRLIAAKRATFDLFRDSETLLRAAEQLNTAYERQLEGRRLNAVVLAAVSLLALACLLLGVEFTGVQILQFEVDELQRFEVGSSVGIKIGQ